MKAITFLKTGDASILKLMDVSIPKIQSDLGVLMKIKAAGINPLDIKLRSGIYPNLTPQILGCDASGVIEAVGTKVQKFKVGDEVFFCYGGVGKLPGNYAEYVVINESHLVHKPKSISFIDAAAAPLVCLTAWEALKDRTQIQPGMKVLIHAGAGGVGHVAIQLAKYWGAQVCTTVGSKEKADFVKSLETNEVIFYKEKDFAQAVLDWTDGKGVDIAFDTVGGETFFKTIPCVKVYGDLVTILPTEINHPNWNQARVRNLRIGLELMLSPMLLDLKEALVHQVYILEQCTKLMEQGHLKIHVDKTFSLNQVQEAHRYLESGTLLGKIVLKVD